jgi:hypothetical protein
MASNTNKKTVLVLAFPLTVIIFILFTKWWIVDVIDGPDCVMYGYPLVYKSPAFHTSMAQQYFIMELLIDLLVYFTIISSILFLISESISKIKSRKLLVILYVIAGGLFGIEILFATVFETSFSIQRDFGITVKQTGFKFYFSNNEKDEFNTMHQ